MVGETGFEPVRLLYSERIYSPPQSASVPLPHIKFYKTLFKRIIITAYYIYPKDETVISAS